jgi:hypothetical protein
MKLLVQIVGNTDGADVLHVGLSRAERHTVEDMHDGLIAVRRGASGEGDEGASTERGAA